MMKSSVELMIAGVIATIGSDLGNAAHLIPTTMADYGVIAGIFIGGLGALSKAFEVGTGFWLKWLDRQDRLKERAKKDKKP